MNEKDFFVGRVVASLPDFDDHYYQLHLQHQGEFGVRYDFTTEFSDYSKNHLTLSTRFDVFIQPDGTPKRIVTVRHSTIFQFENANLLRRGATKKAISTMQRCYDLAQAHAYGYYCNLAEKKHLPSSSYVLSPGVLTEPKILAFLRKYDTVSKN